MRWVGRAQPGGYRKGVVGALRKRVVGVLHKLPGEEEEEHRRLVGPPRKPAVPTSAHNLTVLAHTQVEVDRTPSVHKPAEKHPHKEQAGWSHTPIE